MMLMGISFSALNFYAIGRGLLTEQLRPSFWQQVRLSIGLVMYAVGTLLSLLDARLGLAVYAGLAMFYVVEPLLQAKEASVAD
jgi:hypothetical protein